MLNIVTYTPFHLPLSLAVRARSDHHVKLQQWLSVQPWIARFEKNIDKGFVTTQSDSVSPYFTPLGRLTLNSEIAEVSALNDAFAKYAVKVSNMCMRVYGTGMGIVETTFSTLSLEPLLLNAIQSRDIEKAFTQELENVVKSLVPRFSAFDKNATKRRFRTKPRWQDVSSDAMWTGRCYVTTPDADREIVELLYQAVNSSAPATVQETEIYGSGNCLIISQNCKLSYDQRRALFLTQHYSALLYSYQGDLADAYTVLKSLATLPARKRYKMVQSLTKQISSAGNFTYLALEFWDSVRGLQGKRKPIALAIIDAWEMEALEQSLTARLEYLDSKLSHYQHQITQRVNKSIEIILMLIGGLSVVDITNNFIESAKTVDHAQTWGAYDMFSVMAAENTVNLALMLVLIIALYLARTK